MAGVQQGLIGSYTTGSATLPEGTILLFDRTSTGQAIPSGFSLYTEENGESVTGFLIKGGSVVSRNAGTSAPVGYTGFPLGSGSGGAHGFGVGNFPSNGQGAPVSSPTSTRTHYDGTMSNHTHTVSFPGGTTYPNSATIQGTSVPLIRASSASDTIPQNAIVFGGSGATGFTGFSSKTWSVSGVYSIASSINVDNPAPTNVAPLLTITTNSVGAHTHNRTVPNQTPSTTPGPWTDANSSGGAHTHVGSTFGLVGVWKQFRNLLPFVSTGSSEVQSGMIVMYNGISVPSGWKLCDGTNGTPNMVGFFLGFNTGSAGGALVGRDLIGSTGPTFTSPVPPPSAYGTTPVLVTISTASWVHQHNNARNVQKQINAYTAYHTSGPAPHFHPSPAITFTMPNVYTPRNLTLIFIQKE